jgi:hypothetical protein
LSNFLDRKSFLFITQKTRWEILLHAKLLLLSIVLVVSLVCSCAVSVEASSTWTRTYGGKRGDSAESVIQTSDGGYAIAGGSSSFSNGGCDCWLVKTDAFGNMEWHRHYGGGSFDTASSLVEAHDGGYVLAGHTTSFGAGKADFLVVKTDELGDAEWSHTYGGTDIEVANEVIATSDGGYAIVGYNGTEGADSIDFWLVKIDEFGNMEWNQTYKGTRFDMASSLVEAPDGGYAIVGYTNSFGAGLTDCWLVKTDEFGNMEWNQTYGGWNYDRADSIITTPDGGYAIAGNTDSSIDGDYDVWLIKIDEFGNIEWNKTYGRTPFQAFSDFLRPCSLTKTSDGGYAIAANTESADGFDFWLLKTDAFGVMEWNHTYGLNGDEQALSIIQNSDGEYVMAGFTSSYHSGQYESDFLLVKTEGPLFDSEASHYFSFGAFTVFVSTNSTLEHFNYDKYQYQIAFNVTGSTGTTGFCEVTLSENLLSGEFSVYLDETLLVKDVDYTETYNGTHNIFHITYNHSSHIIEICGTSIIPEHSSCLLPSLLLIATLVIVIYKKNPFTPRSKT